MIPLSLLERLARSTVMIEASDGHGSGVPVWVGDTTLILTCEHVVEKEKRVYAKISIGGKERSYAAVVVDVDEENDLAMLQVKRKLPVESFKLAPTRTVGFEEVALASASDGHFGIAGAATTCGLDGDGDLRIVGGATRRGCSGGPVIDSSGNLLSIVKQVSKDGDMLVWNLAFAVNPAKVRKFVRRFL